MAGTLESGPPATYPCLEGGMAFSWLIFLTVLILGVLQVAVGAVLGRLLAGRRAALRQPVEPAEPLHDLAQGLRQMVAAVAEEVSGHEARLREASRMLAATESGAAASEPVVRTIAGLLRLNEQLQKRLATTEERLTHQAAQIETHFTAARTDALTHLPNRRAFDDELLGQLAHFHHAPSPCGLLWIDIDHFKKLNDRRGHLAGDQALRAVAETLRRIVGSRGLAARVGGEEFAVLLPQTATVDAQQLAERLRATIADAAVPFEAGSLKVTISVGVAAMQEDDDPAGLIRRADEALYAAKRAGRNAAYFHNGQTSQRIASADHDETGWHELCDDLRDRLAEVLQ